MNQRKIHLVKNTRKKCCHILRSIGKLLECLPVSALKIHLKSHSKLKIRLKDDLALCLKTTGNLSIGNNKPISDFQVKM